MKLLFCLPDQIVDSGRDGVKYRPTISLPLGVLSMAAYLREQKWPGEMEIYDSRLSGTLREDSKGAVCFGDGPDDMADRIAAAKPDVVAISNMFSWQVEKAYEMARLAKQACPDATVVFGGPHASSFPREALSADAIDYVVMGEGEERLHKLLGCLEAGKAVELQGVLGREEDFSLLRPSKKAPISFISDLDSLPMPAYDLVDVDRYFHLQATGFSPRPREWGKRAVTMLTSRGCPHQCVFCSIQATMGYKWRHNSPDYVARHIQLLRNGCNIDFIHFEDDNFTYDHERYEQILDVLLAQDKPLPWDTPNGVRGDSWTLERVRKTKLSNCQCLFVAIESAVQRVVDKVVKKRLDLKQVKELMQYCQECRLRLQAFYVIGLPGETEAEIRKTVDFAMDCYDRFSVYPTISMAIPLPGTELHDIAIAGHLYEGELEPKANQLVTEDFDPPLLRRIYGEAMRRKLWIFVKKTLTSRSDFSYNLKLLLQYRSMAADILRHAFSGSVARVTQLVHKERRPAPAGQAPADAEVSGGSP
ncbi:B12-binding domain-containing radical SAM protein [Planctomycetota bacterium]